MSENTKIGALWTKKTKSGGEFFSGMINLDGKELRIVIWPTRDKKHEKSPDYTISIDTWKPGQTSTPPVTPPVSPPVSQAATFVDDIPF